MPLAIEVFLIRREPAFVRIDVNGEIWAQVDGPEVPGKLAEIGRAYVEGQLASLLAERPT
ncbi:MAG: hypothetical protein M3321_00405 [Actinomycetota bacterium]|nr:hypothetical protein [Actinomycetota bacterium]